jgi:hypothetical protein
VLSVGRGHIAHSPEKTAPFYTSTKTGAAMRSTLTQTRASGFDRKDALLRTLPERKAPLDARLAVIY